MRFLRLPSLAFFALAIASSLALAQTRSTQTQSVMPEHAMTQDERIKAHRAKIEKIVAAHQKPFSITVARGIPWDEASKMSAELQAKGFETAAASLLGRETSGITGTPRANETGRVYITGYETRAEAEEARTKLKALGIEAVGIEERGKPDNSSKPAETTTPLRKN